MEIGVRAGCLMKRTNGTPTKSTPPLVEVKYYLQLLSMENAPELPDGTIQDCFDWLIEHPVIPGVYLDPIELVPIDLDKVLARARYIHSGHLTPLDRDGRHVPKNAFLMLATSNQLQGNFTVDELLELMEKIVERHKLLKRTRTLEAPRSDGKP